MGMGCYICYLLPARVVLVFNCLLLLLLLLLLRWKGGLGREWQQKGKQNR